MLPCCGGETSVCDPDKPDGERCESKGDISVGIDGPSPHVAPPDWASRERGGSEIFRSTSSPEGEASSAVYDNPGSVSAPKMCDKPVIVDKQVRKRVTLRTGSPCELTEVKKWSAMKDRKRGEQPKRAMLVPEAIPMYRGNV